MSWNQNENRWEHVGNINISTDPLYTRLQANSQGNLYVLFDDAMHNDKATVDMFRLNN